MAEEKNKINWFPGHMRKALNDTKALLPQVDMVIETCDARIPFSSRNPELSNIIGSKPRLIVLNKADLADPAKTSQWIEALRKENTVAVAVESTNRKGLDKVVSESVKLCKEILERAEAKGRTGRPVRAMVVGVPNTGKSTLINALAGRKAAVTGNKPGVTRDPKWIKTSGRLELMDMPGVLWPKIQSKRMGVCLSAAGCVKDEVNDLLTVAYDTMKMLNELYPDLMEKRYGIDLAEFEATADEFGYSDKDYELFLEMAKKKGCIMSGGRIDEDRFAKLLLDDFRTGRIGRISLEIPM
ncbi:MAG: ribosome biogenesis GTPase YlqF [Clostridiales bacterium]|nr:ribosome biogenesis GTPase YlqF [Clostridiales bacterium]